MAGIRAAAVRDHLIACGRTLASDDNARVRERCSASISAVADVGALAFVPVERDVEVTDAIDAIAGDAALRDVARVATLLVMDNGVFRAMRDLTLRLVGARPHAALAVIARAWPMTFRDCGRAEYQARGERQGALLVYGAYPAMHSSAWMRGSASCWETIASISGTTAARSDDGRVERDTIIWEIRW